MMRPLCFRRPPSRSKTPLGSWPLRGPGLHSTGKGPILMGVQGKDPQWAAGASSMRPLCFADRPGRSKNPLGSSRFAPPRHPWWLSRGFDAAIPQKRPFSGVVFLCHTGERPAVSHTNISQKIICFFTPAVNSKQGPGFAVWRVCKDRAHAGKNCW